jgi:hypothetical protein
MEYKMKTSELTGAALDWAVAKCEKSINDHFAIQWEQGHRNYSSDWSQGGPIIERNRISLRPDYWENGGCRAFIDRGGSAKNVVGAMHGPTPLIAAMRCLVASKLGDEVEIPKELTK